MAMDLLQAGVDCSVIALWLGHESVDNLLKIRASTHRVYPTFTPPGPLPTVLPAVPSNPFFAHRRHHPLRLFERSRIAAGLKTLCAM
jgi:hypothetical protein